jgi:FkbM family methyltransferase
VDVGAYKGHFTAEALVYWRPARVWMVEADPERVLDLRRRFGANAACRVTHAAIASVCGEADLRINENPGSTSLMPIRPEAGALLGCRLGERGTVRVPARTLDALFADEGIDRVDLMKVDIQGAERQLIEGGRRALACVSALLIEVMFVPQYEGAADFEELHRLLRAEGFRLRGFSGGRLASDGTLAYADALFIRPAGRERRE